MSKFENRKIKSAYWPEVPRRTLLNPVLPFSRFSGGVKNRYDDNDLAFD